MLTRKKMQLFTSRFILAAMVFFSPLTPFAEEDKSSVKREAGFYYTIQEGDTLGDIAKRFSDSERHWPDLWHANKQIYNPHLIYPGERIRLVNQQGLENVISDKIEMETDITENSEPLPKEEPQKKQLYYLYTSIDRIGFIKKEPVTPRGFIFKVKDEKEMIHQGDLVYIKQKDKTAPLFMPGSRYWVYRTLKPIKDKRTAVYIGTQHYLTGVVEITKKEPTFTVAKVVKSYRAIKRNDLLMPYNQRSPEIALTESKRDLFGKIIISEDHGELIGDNTIAFINKGEKNGLIPGQFYSIYEKEKKQIDPDAGGKNIFTAVDYGTLLVLHTETTTSTVLITKSQRDIQEGAKIRTPVQ